MDESKCVRCSGKILKDLAGELSCINCGWEVAYSIPLDATPNLFYASLPVTGTRRGAKLKGSSNKQVRGKGKESPESREVRAKMMRELRAKAKLLTVTEEEGTTPVKGLGDAA